MSMLDAVEEKLKEMGFVADPLQSPGVFRRSGQLVRVIGLVPTDIAVYEKRPIGWNSPVWIESESDLKKLDSAYDPSPITD